VLRPVLAGMLSVLLVAGLIGLGVYVASDEPAPAPEVTGDAEPVAAATATSVDKLPPVRIKSLTAAAKAAGCTLSNPRVEGAQHDTKEFTAADYRTNPPTSGTHAPDWYEDGVYAPGTTPRLGMLVHALEHGRIDIQYRPRTPAKTVKRLERLVDELDGGYHLLLFQNETKMPFAMAATAWGHLLGCPKMNDKVFDALRAFRSNYIDKGPETVP
jgi:uncharacterized protein DUF3105